MAKDGLTLRLPLDPAAVVARDPATGQETVRRRYVAYLNGERRDLAGLAAAYSPGDSAPEPALRVAGGRLLLPVRLAAGLFGVRAEWDAAGLSVDVRTWPPLQ